VTEPCVQAALTMRATLRHPEVRATYSELVAALVARKVMLALLALVHRTYGAQPLWCC
jgi:hypothetical protein